MINYKVNPYTVHQSDTSVNSQVVSLVLKDEDGKVIDVSNLHGAISLRVPLKNSGKKPARQAETYSVPEVMVYRVITTHREKTSLRISLTFHGDATFDLYVKYGSRPTKQDYDYNTTLHEGNCQNKTQLCNGSHYVWLHTERPGKYFIGLLHRLRKQRPSSLNNNDRRRRIARSLRQMKDADEELCVKLKEPPTQQPTVQNITLPPYDPPKSVNFTLEVDSAGCLYWSENKEQWMSEGCRVSNYIN